MIQSMTGFSEKSFVKGPLSLKICLKTLNHRFFDWQYKGVPLGETENRLREIGQARLHRGRVEVVVDVDSRDPDAWEFRVNEALLARILASFERASRKIGTTLSLSFDQALRIPQLVELTRRSFDARERSFIETGFRKTLDEVVRGRIREGRALAADIRMHVLSLERSVRRIEKRVQKQPDALQRKIRQKLMGLNHSTPTEERLAEETAFLVQRADPAEELARLKSHLGETRRILSARNSGPAGKKLDFLAQELSREANTMNAKAQDIAVIKESLDMKARIECIRQQVQNIV